MKISLNWLQTYLDIDLPPEELAEILTEIGLEVEGVEKVEPLGGSLNGVVVGHVLHCSKHPNADRLRLTSVDIGQKDPVQIVCGAPNVAVDQKVLVATLGTELRDQSGESWKVRRSKIRGELSEGMICAEDELGLGKDHSGIMVLPATTQPGMPASEYLGLKTDVVFEIGLTPNRSDATNHLGVARDLRAALKINHSMSDLKVTEPDLSDWKVDREDLAVDVTVENTEGCPRYSGVTISNIEVKESPSWLKDQLTVIGVRPINNIVDATNFVLHEMGQPLHAFDYNHIAKRQIIVKTLPNGTSFITLDEQKRLLSEEDLMICDGEGQGMCIAGVFGGIKSGVTETTTDIFLESAHFNAQWIRRSSRRHLLDTDAAWIFEKGSDPNLCVIALKRAAMLIQQLAGGEIASPIVDIYPKPIHPAEIKLQYDKLNSLAGVEITPDEVSNILQSLDIQILSEAEGFLRVSVPTNKVDVTRQADLIEEVLRIYGFNNIPVSPQMTFNLDIQSRRDPMALQNRISDYLVSQGFFEIMGVSMLDKKYFGTSEDLVRINNTSNINLEVMRPFLSTSALEAVQYNSNRQQQRLRLFEFGHTYRYVEGQYIEIEKLSLTVSGWEQEGWLQQDKSLTDDKQFYALKSIVEAILKVVNVRTEIVVEVSHQDLSWGLTYQVNEAELLQLGRIKDGSCKKMDIRQPVFMALINWGLLDEVASIDEIRMEQISRFPTVRRDLALVVEEDIAYTQIEEIILNVGGEIIHSVELFDIYRDASLGGNRKSYAIAIVFVSQRRTLSDQQIDQVVSKLLSELKSQLGAQLR